MVMYLAALALLLLVVIPTTYARTTGRFADEVRKLESEINVLGVKAEDAEAEVARLAGEEDELRTRRISLVEDDSSILSFGSPDELPSLGSSRPSAKPDTPEAYLLSAGLISEKDLEKARNYKSGSKTDYSLGEVLVMMDVISSADWKFALSKCSS